MRLVFYIERVHYSGVFFVPELQHEILTEKAALEAGTIWADAHPDDIVMLLKEV